MASSPRPLPPPDVESRLRAQFGDDVLGFEDQHGHAVATIGPSRYREIVTFLRDEPELACDYCDFSSAVDLGPEGGFEVVTHLYSTTHRHNVRVKVKLLLSEPFEGHPLRKDFPLMSREAKPWPGAAEGEEEEEE